MILLGPLLVQVDGLHGLGILGAQLEDVAHLDAPQEGELPPAAGAGVLVRHIAQVRRLGDLEVPPGMDPQQVVIILVGPGDHGVHPDHRLVGVDGNRRAPPARRSRLRPR